MANCTSSGEIARERKEVNGQKGEREREEKEKTNANTPYTRPFSLDPPSMVA